MTGYSTDEWHGIAIFWHSIIHPEDQERVAEESRAVFNAGGHGVSRFRWIKKDGETVHVEAQSYTIKDENGRPIGTRGIISDITDRTEVERRKDEFDLNGFA